MPGVKGRSGGHNRKSSQVLHENGGFRADRHGNRADLRLHSELIEPPEHLGEAGRRLWAAVIASLPPDTICNGYSCALSKLCGLEDIYQKVLPMVMADPANKPARTTMMAVLDLMDKIGRQFGWTPHSRAGLASGSDRRDAESKALADLLERMRKG